MKLPGRLRITGKYALYFLNSIYILIIIVYLAGGLDKNIREEDSYQLRVIQDNQTGHWYYEVFLEERLLIRQPHIPGIEYKAQFKSRQEAKRIGCLVVERLKKTHSPEIRREDLIKHNIHY